jgi:hypothetical protein
VRELLPGARRLGAEVYVIGNGARHFIAGFRETTGYDGAILTDPALATFAAAGLRRGLRTVLTVATIVRSIGAWRRGFRQGRTQGSALQQGGTLVIGPDGTTLLHHISDGPGDHASNDAILAALQRSRDSSLAR